VTLKGLKPGHNFNKKSFNSMIQRVLWFLTKLVTIATLWIQVLTV